MLNLKYEKGKAPKKNDGGEHPAESASAHHWPVSRGPVKANNACFLCIQYPPSLMIKARLCKDDVSLAPPADRIIMQWFHRRSIKIRPLTS